MQKKIILKVKPLEATDEKFLTALLANNIGVKNESVTGYHIIKRSIDARSRQPWINLTLQAFIDEPFVDRPVKSIELNKVNSNSRKVVIVGSGPAGIFAALSLLENGIKPIILERGKDVRSRRRDLAKLNKEGEINPESNYCFGEGGAGTYSDGKLFTRSNKRGDIDRILNIFVQYGAEEKILYESHPHIGTNKLPHIITAIRDAIIQFGGEVHFEKKVTDFIIEKEEIKGVLINDEEKLLADAVILATGHSARDIFTLMHKRNIKISFKPFALGVRIEHPQALIDSIQYHCPVRDPLLPPAPYSLVQQVNDRGVFSFCMCPGGIIAPASTNPEELVVNGWSPSKRNNPFANSGMVSSVEWEDIKAFHQYGNLAGMYFQESVERTAFDKGGGKFVAPAQRMADFSNKKLSASLPENSYLPGTNAVQLNEVLPDFIFNRLAEGFRLFGKKMPGYFTNEAIVVATESRTSSPVQIPRNNLSLQHVEIKNLYPCGEGAGYAGGIISAAMDGEKVANKISEVFT